MRAMDDRMPSRDEFWAEMKRKAVEHEQCLRDRYGDEFVEEMAERGLLVRDPGPAPRAAGDPAAIALDEECDDDGGDGDGLSHSLVSALEDLDELQREMPEDQADRLSWIVCDLLDAVGVEYHVNLDPFHPPVEDEDAGDPNYLPDLDDLLADGPA